MAEVTERIRLGPACLNPFTVHPVEIAGQMAMLNTVSRGRAYLGISRGAWLDSIGLVPARPVNAMREAIAAIRHLLNRDAGQLPGTTFSLAAHHRFQYTTHPSSVPILIGTWGEKMAALGGELASEVKVGGSANPGMVRVMKRWMDVGAAKGGHQDERNGVVMGAVTVVDEDRSAARARARREVSLYLPVVAPFDPAANIDPALLDRIEAAVNRDDGMAAAALISDDMLDMFAFAGTPEDIIRQTELLFEAGASRVEFGTPHGLSRVSGLRLLGERVLPHFRTT